MKKALESELGFFPTDAETTVVLEPCDGSLHRPAPAVAAQRATILSLGSVGSVGSNHFDAFGRKHSIQRIAVIRLISNGLCREFFGKHEAEEFLDESAFVRRGRAGAHGHREHLWHPQGSCQHTRLVSPISNRLWYHMDPPRICSKQLASSFRESRESSLTNSKKAQGSSMPAASTTCT
jgi:hypothetical protein